MNCRQCGQSMECIIGDYYQCSSCAKPLHSDSLMQMFSTPVISKDVEKKATPHVTGYIVERYHGSEFRVQWPTDFQNKIIATDNNFARIRSVLLSRCRDMNTFNKANHFRILLPGDNVISIEGITPRGGMDLAVLKNLLSQYGLSYV